MSVTVFFSWQSDRPTRDCRNFIEKALKNAVESISKDLTVEEPIRLDKDTLGVPGSPPIFATILQKIEQAAAFVCDVTFVAARQSGDLIPNPNVLIEYGYALKALSCLRIIQVMNTEYGEPSRATMPFDMALNRFPIQYKITENDGDDERKRERDRLSQSLETAIKVVLNSAEYLASLPKPPETLPIKYRQPLDGKARFRVRGEPLGFYRTALGEMIGAPDIRLSLDEGPALWLRVRPVTPVNPRLQNSYIRNVVVKLARLPVFGHAPSSYQVRGTDGHGMCPVLETNGYGISPSVIYLFEDGEIWAVDTYTLKSTPNIIAFSESSLRGSLEKTVEFLRTIGIDGPYRWTIGVEGIRGRPLASAPERFGRTLGACASNVVEHSGTFDGNGSAAEQLEPFFAKLYDQCGVVRQSPA